ncbi:PepSY domain-containing protein [Empedobacter brevis]|uniref:PepSY-associated TM helix domain-containing protein n=1 Tax=Empedobacter brevis TaxID=247 RepID=UPI00123D9829|nr:PepSY-associated TM helix domain-containing protein [Empedobacter brevis]QES93004.1 PepSY domain-containing protein [Empedobacter brevis]
MKKFFIFLHKWLGLFTGIIIFIVAITGAIFCFQDELKDALFSYRKIEVSHQSFIQPSQIIQNVQKKNPKHQVLRVMYMDKNRSTVVMTKDDKKESYFIYVNPYSGQILHQENMKQDFFLVIQYIHMNLLLGEIGKNIIGFSTIIFIIIIISGLILWWPKKKKQTKNALTIKWSAKWKRVNYDLHNVLGFYAFSIAIIVALSGLAFSFKPVRNSYSQIVNLGKSYLNEEKGYVYHPTEILENNFSSVDKAYQYSLKNSPTAAMHWIYLPVPDKNPLAIRAYHKSLRYYSVDEYQFDSEKFQVSQLMDKDLSNGKKFSNAMYDIHTGQILGLLGKLLAFTSSLIVASLPITGFLIWRNKKRKYKKISVK